MLAGQVLYSGDCGFVASGESRNLCSGNVKSVQWETWAGAAAEYFFSNSQNWTQIKVTAQELGNCWAAVGEANEHP